MQKRLLLLNLNMMQNISGQGFIESREIKKQLIESDGKWGKWREREQGGAATPDPVPLPLGPWAARFGCRAPGGMATVGLECDFIGPNGTRAKSLRGAVL